jgi:hypothetical protein
VQYKSVPQTSGADFGPVTFLTSGDGSRVLPLLFCKKGRDLIGALPDCREYVEVDERVGGQHEISIGIDGLAGTDYCIPIAGRLVFAAVFAEGVARAGKEMRDENRVRFIAIERARRYPADLDRFDGLAGKRGVAGQGKRLFSTIKSSA